MTDDSGINRRRLLLAAVLMAPIAITGCSSTRHTTNPLLRTDDPVARSLGYYPNSSDVPPDHPLAASHSASHTCATCVHVRDMFRDGTGECSKFPGRLINSAGWCSLWVQG